MKPSVRITLDDRVGSRHLIGPLQAHDLQVRLKRMDYGDIAFEGWRKDGVVKIGCELKNIGDLIQSLQSRRLVDRQLPGMAKAYDVRYLIVEGIWRPDRQGLIEFFYFGKWRNSRSLITYSQVNRFLTTLELFGGVTVRRTSDVHETAHCIADLYHWWHKPWAKHKGYTGWHKLPVFDTNAMRPDAVRRRLRRVADELPHVGWFRGVDVVRHFSSIEDMVNAPLKRWLKIPRFGVKMATDIRAAITARYK